MKAKSKLHNGVGFIAEFVASGEIELGIQQISAIVLVKGVEVVGPLPPDLQLTTVFATGVGFDAKEQAAAKEFIKFLASPVAAANELAIPPSDDRFGVRFGSFGFVGSMSGLPDVRHQRSLDRTGGLNKGRVSGSP
jgi:hypothetical protein